MPEENISKMTFKELRAEVQSLSDKLARFERLFIDSMNNIDSTNFAKSLQFEQNDMKTKIKVTAEGITACVDKVNSYGESLNEYASSFRQTAESIKTSVESVQKDVDSLEDQLSHYSTIEQTAEAISSVVSKKTNLNNAIEIESFDTLKNKPDADKESVYVVVGYKEYIDENGDKQTDKNTVISKTYYYFDELVNAWSVLNGDSIYSMFNQTSDGFEMKGNVIIDGNTVVTKNLKLQGNVTWDMSNSPVKTQYSYSYSGGWSDTFDSTQHKYMRISFDGGKTWSNPMKVVGDNGKNGTNGSNGSDATVNAENVFNVLTNNGGLQGLFSAFVNNENQLYINAEYIRGKIISSVQYTDDSGIASLELSSRTAGDENNSTNIPDLIYSYIDSSGKETELFKVFHTGTGALLSLFGTQMISYDGGVGVFKPLGSWQFENLGVVPVFG